METIPPVAPPPARASWLRESVGAKVATIVLIVLVLLVPLSLLDGLIRERQQMRESVQREVGAQWGGPQTVGGPVLSVPYALRQTMRDGRVEVERGFVHFLPDLLEVEARLVPERRKRSIYEVVVYTSDITLEGRFGALDVAATGIAPEALDWRRAVLSVGIPDLGGVKTLATVRWDSTRVEAQPGVPTNDVLASGVHFPVAVQPGDGGHAFTLALRLNGSTNLGFLPFGKETRVHARGAWGAPSFSGRFLPDTYTVGDSVFDASWRVLYLNRNYGQAFAGAPGGIEARGEMPYDPGIEAAPALDGDRLGAFGVRLLLPLDEYQKTMRSAEYGLLCLVLTFVTIFFVEILGRRRTHPLQYLLVGFAVSLFYLLLLSFAEYVRFNVAYGLAAVAVLTLILLYTRAIFHSWRYAGIVTGLLVVFYGYFFVLLQLEAYALLFGSLGLLVILGIVMYVSRNVDWYTVGRARDARL